MFRRILYPAVLLPAVFLCLVFLVNTDAREPEYRPDTKDASKPDRIMVLDGSPVHNVGNLHLHASNWGLIGSMPGSGMPFQAAPSAEWPAGSGNEHLYAAGLWVGAIVNGVPKVSTAAYEFEFRPTDDPVDVVYSAAEGDPGGNRIPDLDADDDGDGMIDEEWLDGHDNDGDGAIDEDYAAISDQMMSCWYTDDQPTITAIYPEHSPLHIKVNQRSYQWSSTSFDDFVAFDYTIENTGSDLLEDVYVGWFVDGDVGNRITPNYWEDDATYFYSSPLVCTLYGATSLSFGYVYDTDGDGGTNTGAFGVVMLNHLTDPTGQLAPESVGFNTYAAFTGDQPYDEGGDPTNDFERYDLMSSRTIERGNAGPQDVRFLVSVGPFAQLAPGEKMTIRMAVFAGDISASIEELKYHAALAKLVYNGLWFNLDADPMTGIAGRETPIYGPATNVPVDACAEPPVIIPFVPHGEVAWINADCAHEEFVKNQCGLGVEDSLYYRTGVHFKETQAHWMFPTSGPSAVTISNFAGRSIGDAAELNWRIDADEPIAGFRLHRSAPNSPAIIIPSGGSLLSPDSRAYIDNGVNSGQKYVYTLQAVLPDGTVHTSTGIEISIPGRKTVLYRNKPNPFNPATTISFVLAERDRVNLSVYSPSGKRVVTLVDEVLPAGHKDVAWDGRNSGGEPVSSGIYFYRLTAGNTTLTQKMILLK